MLRPSSLAYPEKKILIKGDKLRASIPFAPNSHSTRQPIKRQITLLPPGSGTSRTFKDSDLLPQARPNLLKLPE
jgi:hypothetical protein